MAQLQTFKGWFYVLITGILLYIILKNHLKKLRLYENRLKEEKERAEEHSELKSAFISNISHEIRTPMNAIVGFSELLYKQALQEDKQIQYAKYIAKNGKQLLAIINNLLDISRIESGQIELVKTEFQIDELLSELYRNFKSSADSQFIDLSYEKNIENHDLIYADKVKLQQILSNLISNALKFTKDGFVKFGCSLEGQNIRFYIEDSGIGIESKHYDKIFERFRQLEKGLDQNYGGTGLGLAISKSYVELMGGRIWVSSSPGKGSLFSFTIPYEITIKEGKKLEKDEKSARDWKDYTILIAEDEESNFLYINELLLDTHVNLIHVVNGQDAVEVCKTNPKINLVLMDIKMPVMHGLDATREIKKTRPELPIIAQTAFAMSKDKVIATEAGCDGYISKPMVAQQLVDLIAKYLP